MGAEEFNELPIEEKTDLLFGFEGKGRLCETILVHNQYKAISIYILGEMLVSVYYKMKTGEVVEVKAWGRVVEKSKMLEYSVAG